MKALTEDHIDDYELKALQRYVPKEGPKDAKYRMIIRIEDEYFAIDVLSSNFLGTSEEDVEDLME